MPVAPLEPLTIGRLEKDLRANAALYGSVVGVSGNGPANVRVDHSGTPTAQQVAAAYAYAQTAFDWGAPAHATWLAARRKTTAKDDYDHAAEYGRVLRAVALVAMDELNILRQWVMSFKAEVAAATSLANLQSRVAGLPNTPDRTPTQVRNAIRNRIDADS